MYIFAQTKHSEYLLNPEFCCKGSLKFCWFSTIFIDGFCHLPFLFPSWRLLHKSIYEGWWIYSWIRCIGINDNDVFDDDDDDDDDDDADDGLRLFY